MKWAWTAWLVAGFALEAYALTNRQPHHSDTLTANIRRTLGIDPVKPYNRAARLGILAGCTWVAWHLTEESKHGPHPERP